MKIVLIRDIDNLGQEGDVKEVANGYARNFLIPRGLAVLATNQAITRAAKIRDERAKRAEQELKATQVLAKKLDGQEIEIEAKAEDGRLFGSVGALKISQTLKQAGFVVKKSQVKLTKPFKEIGEYEVDLDLAHGLEAKIRVIIKAK